MRNKKIVFSLALVLLLLVAFWLGRVTGRVSKSGETFMRKFRRLRQISRRDGPALPRGGKGRRPWPRKSRYGNAQTQCGGEGEYRSQNCHCRSPAN